MIAIKDNIVYEGSIPKIAAKLFRNPETLRRWRKKGIKHKQDSDYDLYFKIIKM